MFEKPKDDPKLEEAIDTVLLEMKGYTPASEEYASMMGHLNLLYKIKDQERPDRVSLDTLATIGANLAGIALILAYERTHIITSKALGFVMKAR